MPRATADLESSDTLLQQPGVVRQVQTDRVGFFHHCGIALRDLIKLTDANVDLLQGGCLFLGATGDMTDAFGDVRCSANDGLKFLADLCHDIHTRMHLRRAAFDQLFDFPCSAARALGQGSDLGRNHRNPLPAFPARAASTAAFRARRLV